jgi:DNA adenine methylase
MKIKPFLKWVGGKSKILTEIFQNFPKEIDTYWEPFLGGGSVLFYLLEQMEEGLIKVKCVKVNDLNSNLINLYNQIKDNHVNFVNELDKLIKVYKDASDIKYEPRHKFPSVSLNDSIKGGKQHVYYYYRNYYNKTCDNKVVKAALFLFLNKTCFRGLYREGVNGFNAPYGNYKNPGFYQKDNIVSVSNLLRKYNVKFENKDYNKFLQCIKLNKFKFDFIYLDPPYHPITDTSFTRYQKDDFTDHDGLSDLCEKLPRFVQSNSKCIYNMEKYKKYTIKEVDIIHTINSKKPGKKLKEILIINN